MTSAAELASGKGHRDENFPVASLLIHPRHRETILAFYRFARAADDIADNETAPSDTKLRLLDDLRGALLGECIASPEAVALRARLSACGLLKADVLQHGLDLLEAFRRDVVKRRYADWNELMDYCRYSAMPVGRFVLDVHGESRATWPASDALCAGLQVINHLQDCGKDYRTLNRVYLPTDDLQAAGTTPEALKAPHASPALRTVIDNLARKNAALLAQSTPFAGQIRDSRLALEVTVIQTLAEDLNAWLTQRDPLCERVHHTKAEAAGLVARATARFVGRKLRFKRPSEDIVRRQ